MKVAQRERARAELRFNDVRKLANSLMFEIHDSIRDLSGATPARKLLVERAVEYLDSLSREASGDLSLQQELAAAYDRVGDLLGYSGAANLGDFPGALENYKKAVAIREAMSSAKPDDPSIQSDLLNSYFRLSFVFLDAGDRSGALNVLGKGLPIAQKLAAAHSDPKYRDMLAGIYWKTGGIMNESGDYVRAADSFRHAISIREPIASDVNSDPQFRTHLVADYVGLATALRNLGNTSVALGAANKGLDLITSLSDSNPTNATLREFLGETYDLTAPLLEAQGDVNLSLNYFRNANRIFAELRAADPANSLARVNFGSSDVGIARELLLKHEIQPAIPHIQEAIAVFEAIEPKNRYDLEGLAEAYETYGMAFEVLADRDSSHSQKVKHLEDAKTWLQQSLHLFEQDPGRGSGELTFGHAHDRVRRELDQCESALAKS